MKLLFLLLFFLFTSEKLMAKTLIISDVDDTIKVTDVLDRVNAAYNAYFSKSEFSGMSQLYRELNHAENIIYYVSGAPRFLEEKVGDFLEFNRFPQKKNLILRNGLSTPIFDYKVATISRLIDSNNPDKIILIGDDTEFDPEVYELLSQKYPSKVQDIYIRLIQKRRLPKSDIMKSFFAATEIAGWEMIKGELSVKAIDKVARSFVHSTKDSKVVIVGRHCPLRGRSEIEDLKKMTEDQLAIDALELTQQKILYTCN
jgi:hypothetical protein